MSDSSNGTQYDVAIIGMGPVGKLAAVLLARRGHSVVIVDKKASDYPLPRAVGHDAEIARILQGAGFAVDEMPEAVEAYDDLYVWVNANREVLQQVDLRGIGDSAWANQYFYNQPALEARLDGAIESLADVTVHRGVTARVLENSADGVVVGLVTDSNSRRPEGEQGARGSAANETDIATAATATTTMHARYVLGADGGNSLTRRDAGIGWHDLGFHFDWLVVDVLPGQDVAVTHLALQICDPVRPTTVVPAGPGRRRWEFMLLDGEDPTEVARAENVWQLLAPFGVTPENSSVERGVVYTFSAGWAESWRAGRVLLLGDAAHLMPPFAAQGLASGFRDALNVVWKLDLVLRGVASEALLDSYQSERVSHVSEFIDFSVALGQVICITDPAIAAGRDAAMTAAIRDGAVPAPPPAPRLGPGIVAGEHGGELSRQGFVTTASITVPTRFDSVFGAGCLIVRGDRAEIDEATCEALAARGIGVVTFGATGDNTDVGRSFIDSQGTYETWFDDWNVAAVLVRPDLTVFDTATDAADIANLAERFVALVS